eukprot:gene5864-biopygen5891
MVEKGSSDGGTEREETTDRDQPEVTREPDAEMEEAAAKAVSQGGGTAQKVHAGSDGLVTDFVLTKWLKEFDTQKAKAVINTHAEASAKVLTFRDRQGGKGKASLVGGAGKGDGRRGSGKGSRGAGPFHSMERFASHVRQVPPARLYLRKLHFVISTKRGWGAKWAEREWHRHTVERFASELSAQLPRYYAQWYDPGCEGVDSLANSWLGEVNWVNPPWSLLDEVVSRAAEHTPDGGLVPGCRVKVYWPVDDDWYVGTVGGTGADGLTHAAYDDGDQEDLDMSKERYEVIPVAVQKAQAFMQVCVAEGRQWLPATKATVRLYIAHLLAKRKVQAASMQPYLSAINNYHEDMGYSGPAKGRGVSRVVKGMSSLQMQAPDAAGEERTVRTWLPARHVSAVHAHRLGLQPVGRSETELLRACAYVVFAFVTFGRPDTGVSMLRAHISIADGIVSVVLHREKGRAHARLERRLTIPAAAGSEGRGSSWGLPWERGKLRAFIASPVPPIDDQGRME